MLHLNLKLFRITPSTPLLPPIHTQVMCFVLFLFGFLLIFLLGIFPSESVWHTATAKSMDMNEVLLDPGHFRHLVVQVWFKLISIWSTNYCKYLLPHHPICYICADCGSGGAFAWREVCCVDSIGLQWFLRAGCALGRDDRQQELMLGVTRIQRTNLSQRVVIMSLRHNCPTWHQTVKWKHCRVPIGHRQSPFHYSVIIVRHSTLPKYKHTFTWGTLGGALRSTLHWYVLVALHRSCAG